MDKRDALKSAFRIALAAMLLAAAGAALATPAGGAPPDRIPEHRATTARELALLIAPIRSRSGLADYLERHRGASTPFDALSPRARQRFIESLTFGTNGLSSFSRLEIESQLSVTEAYRLLALFGAQHLTSRLVGLRRSGPGDTAIMESGQDEIEEIGGMADYRCNPDRQVCEPRAGSICMADSC